MTDTLARRLSAARGASIPSALLWRGAGTVLAAVGAGLCAAGLVIFTSTDVTPAARLLVDGAAAALMAWTVQLARHAQRLWRMRSVVPAGVHARRWHGTSAGATGADRRPLRPVGMELTEMMSRTVTVLADLLTVPGLHVFAGVSPPDLPCPPTSHVVAVGRTVLLIESVALPPGTYRTAADGQLYCDGVYTGQSVGPLQAAIDAWRAALPHRHRVLAVVVVHRTSAGVCVLPPARRQEVTWVPAHDARRELLARLPAGGTIDIRTFARLVSATSALWESRCSG